MKSVDFLFLIEHEDREMAVAQKLKENLTKAGLKVSILSIEFHAHLYKKIVPKNIVFPYAISTNTWPIIYFLDTKYAHSNFISLNWEQLLSTANQKFKKPKGDLLKKHFKHLAWHEDFLRFLTESGVNTENVRVIGNPLHELLHEDIQKKSDNRLKLKKEFGKTLDNEVVFFPMNYGWAFFDEKKIIAKIKQGYDESTAYDYRSYSKKCLEKYLDFIVELANTNTNKTFVIRPHPSITENQYIESFESRGLQLPPNILITKMFTIKEWISISSIVGSSWSTSVWDSVQIGKPGFLFTPYPRPHWLETYWNTLVPNISSPEEFKSLTKTFNQNKNNPDNIILRITDWLLEIASHKKSYSLSKPSYFLSFNVFLYTLRSRIRYYLMSWFNGVGVKDGLKRDFFKPQI